MIKLKDIKMKTKLITVFLLVGLIPLAFVGWWNARLSTNALMAKSYAQLEAVRGIKTTQIEKYFSERKGDMGVLTETVVTLRREAFAKLQAVQKIKKSHLTDYFETIKSQLQMLKDDPYIMNALTEFDQVFEAGGDSVNTPEWNALAKIYDSRLRDVMKDNEWDDIFLIHKDGGIVYTVTRESDLGMVIPDSELRDQGIGKAFHEARKMSSNEIAVADMAPYSPSGGKPVSFMMAQMRDKDRNLKGYVAFQIPLAKINKILLQREGMGKTGETYLVGQDMLMRSDSFLDKEGHSVIASFKNSTKVETEAVHQALAGKEGQKVIIDYNGNPVLSCWDYINLSKDIRWAMMSEIDVVEAFSPVDEDGNEFFGRYKEMYGYYDLFLINPDGYIFYTVEKEPDYKTNIVNGKYSGSNLSKLVRQVLNTKQLAMGDFAPYAPSNNEPAAFIAQPLVNQGNVDVVVALQLSIDAINSIMQERTGMGKTGETYLVGADKLMRSDSFIDPANHSVKASFANPSKGSVDTDAVNEALTGKTDSRIINDYNGSPVLSSFTPLRIEGITWVLISEIDEDEVKEPVRELLISVIRIGLLVAVLIAVFAFFIAKSIAAPLVKGVEFARLVARGDLTADIDVSQKDEVGMLADALKEMIARIRDVVAGVNNSSRNVTASAEQLASVSQQMSSGSQEMSHGTSEQSAATEEVSASMEQMASNIRQNADNALQTEKLAMKSAEDAKEGGKAVYETVSAMKQIAEKISIIEEIARQTDLLALNAAVEAARAGQHGKGFAVVASEVRKLAERSQRAAVEINKLSSASVSVAENAGEMLKRIVPDIKKTSELVREISAACGEQDTGAAQVNEAILQLDRVAQQNASVSGETAASAEEMSATAEELSAQAEELQRAIGFFKIEKNTGYSSSYSSHHDQTDQHSGLNHGAKDAKASRPPIAHQDSNAAKGKKDKKAVRENEGYSIELSGTGKSQDKIDSEFEVY